MRKLMVREVETVKTTAACYCCGCPGLPPCDIFGIGVGTVSA